MYYLVQRILEFQRIDSLIRRKQTGPPEAFAVLLSTDEKSVSRSTVYARIAELKDFGANIKYDHERKTFYYEDPFDFPIKLN
jgi:hypothetical protein